MPTTKCSCGAEITYKTKPPKLCPSCQAKEGKTAKRGKRPPKSSRKELTVSRLIMDLFPQYEVIHNGYYSWLRSPKNQPMQLDVYIPELKIAFEVDGRQHFQYSTFLHGKGKKGLERFQYLQACDKLKDELCKKRGVRLIRIRYDRRVTREYLLTRLKNEGIAVETT